MTSSDGANTSSGTEAPHPSSWQSKRSSAISLVTSQAMVLSTHITVEMNETGVGCSNSQALMNLIKGTAGTGILSLPYSFKNVGLWGGLGMFVLVAVITVHCMVILVSSCEILEKRSGKSIMTYVDAVEMSIQYGPMSLRKSAVIVKHITSISINIMQCSFCCVYIVWVSVNLKEIIDNHSSFSPSVRVYEAAVFIILIPYIMIQSLKTLALFSAFANMVYLVGLIIIFQYIVQDLPDSRSRPTFGSWDKIPLFFGTAMFAFESICLTIPIRSKMQNMYDFGGWNGLLSLGMVIITAIYSAIGFYGYLRFGADTATTITLNLPQKNWLYVSVTILFIVAMIISVGVQFYVPITIIWPAIEKHMDLNKSSKFRTIVHVLTRVALLVLIVIVSLGVPHIDLLMSLIGSFFGSFLSLIIPALIEILTLKEDKMLTVLIVVKNVGIIFFGILILIFGTYQSMEDIIKTF
ncbi:hypothetical protein Btru_064906 [Bulinus truncatus]|nr:hypothetical protein Btru_064906 [Bulinus truncatus]